MKNTPIIVFVMLAALGCTAGAEGFVPDGRAKVDDTLREFLPTTQGWSRASMRSLLSRVLLDQRIDGAEMKLLRELQAGAVDVEFSEGSEVHVPHPEKEALKQLSQICVPIDLASLWKKGPDGARTMVELATLAPVARERIVRYAASQFYTTSRESNILNGYDPLRKEIHQVYADMRSAGGETETEGALILYDALQMVHERTGDSVPKFLYEWLGKPLNP